MTSFSHYVWIYGLAEALALSLALTVLFGIGWWKLRQERKRMELTCTAIAGMLKEEIIEIKREATAWPGFRDSRLACLRALSQPFKKRRLGDETLWKTVAAMLNQCFDTLVSQSARQSSEPGSALEATASEESDADDEGLSGVALNAGVDTLLASYQVGQSVIATNRETTTELKRHYRQLQIANQNLRKELEADKTTELWQIFDTYERSNATFMKTLSAKERNYNILVKEFEGLQGNIHNLQTKIANYRKSAHQLLLEKSALTEENKQLIEQHEVTDKLVVRLNRNYDTLRNEYTKLFETTR